MPDTLVYPTSVELEAVEQVLIPRLTENRLGFQLLPLVTKDHHRLIWEQMDNYTGLQQVRGLNGQPQSVVAVGAKQYEMKPGVYGEFMPIDEEELTLRRQPGSIDQNIDLTDITGMKQMQLLGRRLDRIELNIWTLLTTGTFSVANAQGAVLHTDTYPILTYTAGVTWATSATATPLANFRAIQLLGRGQSAQFGGNAMAIMNRVTLNSMLSVTNINDIAGRRTSGLLSYLTLNEINSILLGEGLPQIMVYDEGYLNDSGTFVPFIGNGVVIVVGKRPDGVPLGEYRMTRNASKPGSAPGAYTYVDDSLDRKELPRTVKVHDGHNGGPVIFFPGGFIRMNV